MFVKRGGQFHVLVVGGGAGGGLSTANLFWLQNIV